MLQAAPVSKEEVTPLLAADTLAPNPKTETPHPGPSSVAEQLDAMKPSELIPGSQSAAKGGEVTYEAQDSPTAAESGLRAASPTVTNPEGITKDGHSQEGPVNPISDSVPGTAIAPDHPGDSLSTPLLHNVFFSWCCAVPFLLVRVRDVSPMHLQACHPGMCQKEAIRAVNLEALYPCTVSMIYGSSSA